MDTRLIRLFSVFLLLILCALPLLLSAQNDSTEEDEIVKKNWEKGYIVLGQHNMDTIRGYLNIKTTDIGYMRQVWFRKDPNEKKATLKIGRYHLPKDTLRFFGVGTRRCRWVHWTDMAIPTKLIQKRNSLSDWVELVEEGAITISLGFSVVENQPVMMTGAGSSGGVPMMSGSSISYTPVFCLKKGSNPLALITGHSFALIQDDLSVFKVNERNRDYFIGIIADDQELAEKIKDKDLHFMDIQYYVHVYNEWAKDNKK